MSCNRCGWALITLDGADRPNLQAYEPGILTRDFGCRLLYCLCCGGSPCGSKFYLLGAAIDEASVYARIYLTYLFRGSHKTNFLMGLGTLARRQRRWWRQPPTRVLASDPKLPVSTANGYRGHELSNFGCLLAGLKPRQPVPERTRCCGKRSRLSSATTLAATSHAPPTETEELAQGKTPLTLLLNLPSLSFSTSRTKLNASRMQHIYAKPYHASINRQLSVVSATAAHCKRGNR
ncbi:hypothetical protein QBC40DRAFT_345208 [Triangularia verruculosa]|uniref:Uncharacterized protein n=1 Tax=Triangularia verruculosa TaxID=2587418 RepID=A0AAN6XW19_9PEZI|nr:hypothetical protein QBC40DRAFT_345208 [Triangularia verruculosa]